MNYSKKEILLKLIEQKGSCTSPIYIRCSNTSETCPLNGFCNYISISPVDKLKEALKQAKALDIITVDNIFEALL